MKQTSSSCEYCVGGAAILQHPRRSRDQIAQPNIRSENIISNLLAVEISASNSKQLWRTMYLKLHSKIMKITVCVTDSGAKISKSRLYFSSNYYRALGFILVDIQIKISPRLLNIFCRDFFLNKLLLQSIRSARLRPFLVSFEKDVIVPTLRRQWVN